jgi:hypothetical protein
VWASCTPVTEILSRNRDSLDWADWRRDLSPRKCLQPSVPSCSYEALYGGAVKGNAMRGLLGSPHTLVSSRPLVSPRPPQRCGKTGFDHFPLCIIPTEDRGRYPACRPTKEEAIAMATRCIERQRAISGRNRSDVLSVTPRSIPAKVDPNTVLFDPPPSFTMTAAVAQYPPDKCMRVLSGLAARESISPNLERLPSSPRRTPRPSSSPSGTKGSLAPPSSRRRVTTDLQARLGRHEMPPTPRCGSH